MYFYNRLQLIFFLFFVKMLKVQYTELCIQEPPKILQEEREEKKRINIFKYHNPIGNPGLKKLYFI